MCQAAIAEVQSLARHEGLGSITLCSCGTISLHVGGVSVRMELASFIQTAGMCEQAMKNLESQALTLLHASQTPISTTTH
ncbi:hypothetical protein [Granulicella arctica]|uniref:Uncharacterized protein n=1 Tax=Granulicella arctica TaxID=940613 RepID=A0A7Y9PJZ0_9BACT|nr:hypothetical protein [Granulicella arctica]NYF81242.1 hypothetical protein [Granulicella arctica]